MVRAKITLFASALNLRTPSPQRSEFARLYMCVPLISREERQSLSNHEIFISLPPKTALFGRQTQFVAKQARRGEFTQLCFCLPFKLRKEDEDGLPKTVDTHCFAVRDEQTQKRRLRCPRALLSLQRTRE